MRGAQEEVLLSVLVQSVLYDCSFDLFLLSFATA